MENIIDVKELSRVFKNKSSEKVALDKISFSVKEGEVFGLLGPNGAGKTTAIKILTTLLLPSSGDVKVLGYDVIKQSHKIREKINFVYGGERGVYGRLTAREYLHYFCTLYRISNKNQKNIINELLTLVDLQEAENQLIHTYSKGMIQRLHIARCLINEPKIIFLDEPTIGLDPIGAKLLRNIVKRLSNNGITIILTTHYMQEADELCDRIAFIKNGKIKLIGEPDYIKQSCNHSNQYQIIMSMNNDSISDTGVFRNVQIEEINKPYYMVKLEAIDKKMGVHEISRIMSEYGNILKIDKKEITLEDAYIYYMKDVI